MRAGLLSDPRVIALLRREFVPCMTSALNTPGCFRDPRDAETLARYVDPDLDDFDGGEREAFVLPDGTMLDVFLSLHGPDRWSGHTHYTREGRRSEDAARPFREHAEDALRRVHGALPEDWEAIWAGQTDAVKEIAATAPRWPEPAEGERALRVFARNSYRMYDDLAGCELVPFEDAEASAWIAALSEAGAEVTLEAETFRRIVRAMVPRGMVATHLADGSIDGEITLTCESTDGAVVRGRIEGTYAMTPRAKSEVGARENAACLFRSAGRIRGRFAFDREAARVLELRAATADVEFAWLPGYRPRDEDFPPRHAAAFEWIQR